MNYQLDTQVRIAGQGGAGVFFEPLVLPPTEAESPLRSGADITLLSPDRLVTYLSRPVRPFFMVALAVFLRAAAVSDGGPDLPVPFEDPVGLVRIDITPADGKWVEIEVRIAQMPDEDVVEFDGMNFETTRASLLIAAHAAEAVHAHHANRGD